MDIETIIKNCEICIKQIKQYNPDPYYVNYFFDQYINSVNKIFDEILGEANREFGLFISEKISLGNFFEKAKNKNDQNAMKFLKWYLSKHEQEHKNTFPNSMKKICQFKNDFGKIPAIKIMMSVSNKFKDDTCQQIKVNLNNGKLRSREELIIEYKRQLPIFLEIINYKRNKNNEPKIKENQVIISTFLDIGNNVDIEIVHIAEIYIRVIKRLVEESRKKIKELTIWQ